MPLIAWWVVGRSRGTGEAGEGEDKATRKGVGSGADHGELSSRCPKLYHVDTVILLH